MSPENIKILHENLAETVINFFKEHGLPKDAWMLTFSFDDLKSSVEAGKWVPYSDSSLELWDSDRNCLVSRM